MHSNKKKPISNVSRRTFIAAMASLPVLSLPWSSANAALTVKPFSFVFVTDVHLAAAVPDDSFKLLQESQLFLQDTIKSINALKPDFVIFGGDQVETVGKNEANWQLFIDLVHSLNAPWTFVLGEQDVSGKNPVDKMKTFGLDFKGRGITGNAPWWSTDPMPDVHLIGLDSSQPNTATGDLSAPQLEWLKKDLAANKGKFTIVACHHPLLPPAPYDGGPPWDDYVIPNGSDAREIIGGTSDVRMVLSGHLYMNKVQVERDVYHVSCAGLDIYPCQYKYFKVTKDAITMESFQAPLPALVKRGQKALESSALASRINRRDPSKIIELCQGSPEDQNAWMSLGSTKSVKELSRKTQKEDADKRDDELDKQTELARNKGNVKGKKGKKGKDEEKSDKDSGKASAKPDKDGEKSSAPDASGSKDKIVEPKDDAATLLDNTNGGAKSDKTPDADSKEMAPSGSSSDK